VPKEKEQRGKKKKLKTWGGEERGRPPSANKHRTKTAIISLGRGRQTAGKGGISGRTNREKKKKTTSVRRSRPFPRNGVVLNGARTRSKKRERSKRPIRKEKKQRSRGKINPARRGGWTRGARSQRQTTEGKKPNFY